MPAVENGSMVWYRQARNRAENASTKNFRNGVFVLGEKWVRSMVNVKSGSPGLAAFNFDCSAIDTSDLLTTEENLWKISTAGVIGSVLT